MNGCKHRKNNRLVGAIPKHIMTEVVNGDINSCKSANVGERKELSEGDGGIDVPGKLKCGRITIREMGDSKTTYLLVFSSKYSKAPAESSTGQPSTKRAEGQYSALKSIFAGTMVKGSLKHNKFIKPDIEKQRVSYFKAD